MLLSDNRACAPMMVCAGQAVVQIAEDIRSRREYAFKFFVSRTAFEQEAKLYEDPEQPLGRFLPELRCILDKSRGNEMHDRNRSSLPPCIVMEKGEALDLFTARTEGGLDMVTGLQVCTAHACKLSLHAADLHALKFST